MEDATRKLLEECSSGCKMAIDSINQVSSHVNGDQLAGVLGDYKRRHENLEKRTDDLLRKGGAEPKAPGMAAAAFSWLTTEMKMKLHNDNSQVSKLMMDGCNMGIQSISGFMNEYSAASHESMELAKELVHTEEAFMKDLKSFL